MAESYEPDLDYLNVQVPDIPHPDSSRYTHNKVRYGWDLGQQLWGPYWNANSEWVGIWAFRWAHYRRKYPATRPPYYTGMIRVFMLDPNQYTASIPGGVEDHVAYTFPMGAYYYKPWAGCKVTVLADRMLIAYSQGEWKAAARFEKFHSVEVAFFVSQPKAKSVMARIVIDQPMRLTFNNKGRVRNWPITASVIHIRRNGVVIGEARQSRFSSFARAAAATDFAPGDVLDIYAPGATKGARNLAVSIIGTVLP